MIGLYVAGNSVLHRVPAGLKLLLLAIGIFGVLLLRRPWQMGIALLAVIALYALATVPWQTAWAQLRPLVWIVVIVASFQLVFAGVDRSVMVAGALVVNVALAALLTLTTKVTAILDVCQWLLRPFRRVGLDPDRIGLMLALTIRCVPLVAGIVSEVSDARKARGVIGLRGSVVALAAPAVIRALRAADAIGESLTARGIDD
ncbi:biotin transport system permease protein [Antricoccus suffuscus]|uniref:Biotin transport system permease protein n=2 Tax=Antricoccus suffuscus TaxID=1629062 RepID=A0A2T1A520_9ACTN|nr:biotin transport system permease protein [Antricoccus suffuscus]